MATFATFRFLKSFFSLILLLETISAENYLTFSFQNFGRKSKYNSTLALSGDAKVVNGSSSIQITEFSKPSAGRVFLKTPIKLVEGNNPKRHVSFSTSFVFSISGEDGDGLAFVMVPLGFPFDSFDGGSFGLLNNISKFKFLSVELDTKMDVQFGDLNGNHVGINVNSLVSVQVSNVSETNLVLNSGEKLQAVVDYEASWKRLEIRLNRFGEMRPLTPLLSFPIDLSHMWKEDDVLIGLSSSNEKSMQKCVVYSWSFKIRQVPEWMHSEPLDPTAISKNTKAIEIPKEQNCQSKVLGALMFGISYGALGAFFVIFVWTVFRSKRPVVPEDFALKDVDFEPKKLKVVVEKSVKMVRSS